MAPPLAAALPAPREVADAAFAAGAARTRPFAAPAFGVAPGFGARTSFGDDDLWPPILATFELLRPADFLTVFASGFEARPAGSFLAFWLLMSGLVR